MGRQELARVHDPVGIKDTTEPRHEVEVGGGELERHALRLVHSDAMLAGDAAAQGQAGPEQRLVGRLRPLELAGDAIVVEDHGMQVAVARVEDVGDPEPVAGADGLHLPHDLGQPRARHHRILEQPVARHAPDHAGRLLPSLPEERPLGVIPRHADLQRRVMPADRHDADRLGLDLVARPVELDEQHRPRTLRVPGSDPLLDGLDEELVDQLERGGDDAGGDDRGHGLRGVVQGG